MTGGAASRDRGARGEREVVQIIRDAGWPDAHRTSRGVAQQGHGDIEQGPAGLHIECKFTQRTAIPAAFDQAKRDARPLDIPSVVHRPARHEWMITLSLDAFLRLAQEAGL